MGPIEIKTIESFVSHVTEVAILDQPCEDQARFVKITIQKAALCPDGTHLRIYFDDHNFFAIPLTASVSLDDGEWSAFDQDSGLYYVIRKERGTHV